MKPRLRVRRFGRLLARRWWRLCDPLPERDPLRWCEPLPLCEPLPECDPRPDPPWCCETVPHCCPVRLEPLFW